MEYTVKYNSGAKMNLREMLLVLGTLSVFPLVSCNYNHDSGDLQQEHLLQRVRLSRFHGLTHEKSSSSGMIPRASNQIK
jgi:hypothetical protein